MDLRGRNRPADVKPELCRELNIKAFNRLTFADRDQLGLRNILGPRIKRQGVRDGRISKTWPLKTAEDFP
jgi:hypothetical protein